MTVRAGWPTFGQWQQNRALRRRTRSVGVRLVEITVNMDRFREAMEFAGEAARKLSTTMNRSTADG